MEVTLVNLYFLMFNIKVSLPSPGLSPWSSPRSTPRSPSLSRTMSSAPGTDPSSAEPDGWKPSHLVKLHELPDAVEHVVVLGRGAGHLLDDGGHVSEDGGVEEG